MQTNHLKIGQLAKLAQVSIETLRFYEANQLLVPSKRDSNGYRQYTAADKQRLFFILHAKKIGFSLKEIKHLLSLRANKDTHTCAEVQSYTRDKIGELEQKINDLEKMKMALLSLHKACCGGPESAQNCTILSSLDDPEFFQH
ncbi:Zn(2+)-responsive transcriptional regulator [Aliikangiella sp. IMCC44653]